MITYTPVRSLFLVGFYAVIPCSGRKGALRARRLERGRSRSQVHGGALIADFGRGLRERWGGRPNLAPFLLLCHATVSLIRVLLSVV